MIIEDVSIEQLDSIVEIEKQCFSVPWTWQQLKSQLKDDSHEFICALDGEKVTGYVGMMYVLDEGYISNVAVSPDHRREGIADALIDGLVSRCISLKLTFVTLEVRESNAPPSPFTQSTAFLPWEDEKTTIHFLRKMLYS